MTHLTASRHSKRVGTQWTAPNPTNGLRSAIGIGDRPSNLNNLSQLLRLAPHFRLFLQPVLIAAQHATYRCGGYLQDSRARPEILANTAAGSSRSTASLRSKREQIGNRQIRNGAVQGADFDIMIIFSNEAPLTSLPHFLGENLVDKGLIRQALSLGGFAKPSQDFGI